MKGGILKTAQTIFKLQSFKFLFSIIQKKCINQKSSLLVKDSAFLQTSTSSCLDLTFLSPSLNNGTVAHRL